MDKLKQLQSTFDLLKEGLQNESQEKLRNNLSNIALSLGYEGVANEVKNNRNPKENLKGMLNMFLGDISGDRINIVTNEVLKADKKTINQCNEFKKLFNNIIDLIDNNTPNQKEYLKLKIEFINIHWKLAQLYKESDLMEDYEKEDDKKIEIFNKYYNKIKELQKQQKEIENKFDNFIMNNLK
jgi:hypothetical protein